MLTNCIKHLKEGKVCAVPALTQFYGLFFLPLSWKCLLGVEVTMQAGMQALNCSKRFQFHEQRSPDETWSEQVGQPLMTAEPAQWRSPLYMLQPALTWFTCMTTAALIGLCYREKSRHTNLSKSCPHSLETTPKLLMGAYLQAATRCGFIGMLYVSYSKSEDLFLVVRHILLLLTLCGEQQTEETTRTMSSQVFVLLFFCFGLQTSTVHEWKTSTI